jgi:hypothetical protein
MKQAASKAHGLWDYIEGKGTCSCEMAIDFQKSQKIEFVIATSVRTANHSVSIVIAISVPKIDSMGEHKLEENKCL